MLFLTIKPRKSFSTTETKLIQPRLSRTSASTSTSTGSTNKTTLTDFTRNEEASAQAESSLNNEKLQGGVMPRTDVDFDAIPETIKEMKVRASFNDMEVGEIQSSFIKLVEDNRRMGKSVLVDDLDTFVRWLNKCQNGEYDNMLDYEYTRLKELRQVKLSSKKPNNVQQFQQQPQYQPEQVQQPQQSPRARSTTRNMMRGASGEEDVKKDNTEVDFSKVYTSSGTNV